jgi:two-component system nitrogen regulation response regulator NtrX
MLVREFSKEFTAEMNRKSIRFDDAAMKFLTSLPFSGNIRELRNVIERIVILVAKEVVHLQDVEHLGLAFSILEHSSISQDGMAGRDVNFLEEATDDFSLTNPLLETNHRDTDEPLAYGRTDQYAVNVGDANPLDEAMQAQTFQEFKDRAEKAFIEEKLREQNWNISRTAEALDIQRSHLYTKMRKFGLMKDARIHELPMNDQQSETSDSLDEDDTEFS